MFYFAVCINALKRSGREADAKTYPACVEVPPIVSMVLLLMAGGVDRLGYAMLVYMDRIKSVLLYVALGSLMMLTRGYRIVALPHGSVRVLHPLSATVAACCR